MNRLPVAAAIAGLLWVTARGQAPDDRPRRIDERLRTLQRENEQLANQAKTLVGDLRRLEIERDLRVQEWKAAEAAAAEAQQVVTRASERLAAVQQQRAAQLPDLKAQFVDVYKRRQGGYLRLLFGARDLRDFARTTRAVASLMSINERRVAEHRRTLQELSIQRLALQQSATRLRSREAEAREARAAAERAVENVASMIARIDSRRDLTAQYVGELQVAYERLQQQVAGGPGARPRDGVAIPLAPFRGALEWPATGRLAGRFGQASERLGGSAVRNGIEIAVPENTVVRAVHGGSVGLAGPFTGFGNLVIVEHGAEDYSLYGYLGSLAVERGATVEAGTELGRTGTAPGGPPALYFEMRIDGKSVDPLQWLKAR